jgi:hypothetical protein
LKTIEQQIDDALQRSTFQMKKLELIRLFTEATQELQKDRERLEFFFGNKRAYKSKQLLELHCQSLSRVVSVEEWREAIDSEIAAISQEQKENK